MRSSGRFADLIAHEAVPQHLEVGFNEKPLHQFEVWLEQHKFEYLASHILLSFDFSNRTFRKKLERNFDDNLVVTAETRHPYILLKVADLRFQLIKYLNRTNISIHTPYEWEETPVSNT